MEWTRKIVMLSLPVQDVPMPLYPVLHAQLKDPALLVHVALPSQLCSASVHSSLSKQIRERKENRKYNFTFNKIK